MSQQGLSGNKQVQYYSVVKELQLDDESAFMLFFKDVFKFGRRLKPKVKKRTVTPFDSTKEVSLNFHVIRATDVPIRNKYFYEFKKYLEIKEDQGEDNRQQAYQRLFKNKQNELFVEVKLYDPDTKEEQIVATSVQDGQYPEWNEILELKIKAKNRVAFT